MFMISPLNGIDPIISSLKQENVLVLLKCQGPFISYTNFESCLSCDFLVFGLRISALFNGL